MTPFHQLLVEVATRIARDAADPQVDAQCLWKAFLHIAHLGEPHPDREAARAVLRDRFGERLWTGLFPEALPPSDGEALPESRLVKRCFGGALSVLGKRYGGQLTPECFVEILEDLARKELGDRFTPNGFPELIGELEEPHIPTAAPPTPEPGAGPGDDGKTRGDQAASTSQPAAANGTAGLSSALDALAERLEREVFGQTSAVRLFVEGLRTSLGRRVRFGRLGGSFLIFGPNGSGKSELLWILEGWLAEHRDALPVKRLIHCEGYLYGMLPTLRQKIREGESGPAFIAFSEIEKYEPAVRDVLMEGLDRAVLQLPDRSEDGRLVETDIKGSIVILLGNVGRPLWGRLPFKEKEILPDQERIREVLESEAVAGRHQATEYAKTRLDRSFLDRVDWFVPFCQLRYADVEKVAKREIRSLGGELRRRGCTLEVDQRVVDLTLLAAHYKRGFSARQTLRAFKTHIETPVRAAVAHEAKVIELCCSRYDEFAQALEQKKPALLVIDDEFEGQLGNILHAGLGDGYSITGVKDLQTALAKVSDEGRRFDLVLLDMHFGPDKGWMWEEYLGGLREHCPDTPVVLFSQMSISTEVRHEIDRLGGVLGLARKSSDPERLAAALAPFLDHASWQAKLRAFEERYGFSGDRILFEIRTAPADGNGRVKIEYDDVRTVVDERTGDLADEPVLSDEVHREIHELVRLFSDPARRRKLGVPRPKGVLLYGPPGNGKTMTARWIARQIRCNFLAVNAGELKSKFAGVAAERIRELFDKARMRQPCVVFIDEIDAVAPPRREGSGGGGVLRDDAVTVATLLTELDGFDASGDVFVIGATNRLDAVDAAVRRKGRLDREIRIANPAIDERRKLLARELDRLPGHEIDLEWAARETYGLSGADVVAVTQDALFLAARRAEESGEGLDGLVVTQHDLVAAADRLRYGVIKGEGDPRTRALRAQRRYTAWHEAGHAVLSISLLGEVPDRVTIAAHGEHLGFVRHAEEDLFKRRLSPETCVRIIATSLAGGLAEERKFGNHDPGVSSDRRHALGLASGMVAHWGMGTLQAEVSYFLAGGGDLGGSLQPGGPQLGLLSPPNYAQDHLVEAVAGIMEKATELARHELEVRWGEVEKLSDLLMERENLGVDEVRAALGDLVAECAGEEARVGGT